MVAKVHGYGSLSEELDGAELGDKRLTRRLQQIASRVEAAPSESFPEQTRGSSELEAAYRFFSNEAVTMQALLEPHFEKTKHRIAERRIVRIVHDTTELRFSGDREGIGRLKKGARGFYAHVALAVGDGELREPLGVIGVRPHTLEETADHRGLTAAERNRRIARTPREQKLSSRWEKLVKTVGERLPSGTRAIHVMDREADQYPLFAEMLEDKASFVIRGAADRRLYGDANTSVVEALSSTPASLLRTVRINQKSKSDANPQHPERLERDAILSIRFGTVTFRKQSAVQSSVHEITVNAVHVFEAAPTNGVDPIEWMLFTSEPVSSFESAADVVDHYRARWIIEELFKALKTGCSFEKRQLTTYDALLRALGLFLPMAWRLLFLRHLGRAPKPPPASTLFDAEQLTLLAALAAERKRPLPAEPTIRDAMLAIGALGGHLKTNGDPGWIVLGRGHRKFVEAEHVWRLARLCDQS